MPALFEDTTEARYRTLFERAPLGIVYADAKSVYLDANDAACRLLGYTREELIGLHASDIVQADEVPAIEVALAEIHGDREHQREWTFRRKDGSTFVAEVTATKFPDGTLLGMIRDVSELRHQSDEVRRLNRTYSALSRVNQAILLKPSRDVLFERICRILVDDGGLLMAWIGWLDTITREVKPVASSGDDSGYLARIRITDDDGPDGMGPTGTAMRTGKPYISSDLLADPSVARWHAEFERRGFRSSAALPIRIAEQTVGAIIVYADRTDAFHAKELDLLIEVANNLSLALDHLARDEARFAAERTLGTEKRFSDTIIESMPGVLYIFDTAGRFLRWNRNFEVISGYSSEEVGRMHPTEFFPLDERDEIGRRISDAFTDGETAVAASLLARDGTMTPYFFTGRRIEFAGRTCLVGLGIDIAEQTRAQHRAEDSEAHLLAAQRIARLGSWEFGLVDGVVRWSDQVFEILGLPQATTTPSVSAFLSMVHREDRASVAQALDSAARGETPLDNEHRILRPDGTERVVHGRGALRRDSAGRATGLAGTLQDVTERKRDEARLRLRDRAIQQVAQGILITQHTDAAQPIIFASAGFERMTGYTVAEVMGMNCRFLQGKDTDPVSIAAIHTAVAASQPVAVEIRNYRKDGTPFWNALSLNPVFADDGSLEFYVGVLTDITERRHLSDQLRQSQKMEAVGRLAGGIAHDFNNLLTVIGGYSEQLLTEGGLTEDMLQSVGAIHEAGKRAGQLTRQLLSFGRQAILQPRIIDVNTHVARTAQMLRRMIGEDVEFSTILDQHCATVRVDPGQLDQIMMNLVVNARDAMPRGGRLTLETRPITLNDSERTTRLDCPPGDYVMLAMTDTGTGMSRVVADRVFEPFFTTKGPGKGTGLGLSMVFGIVKQSEGAIEVESEPGIGTTFRIYLPAVTEVTARVSDPVTVAPIEGTETILVVEDDDDVRALAVKCLKLRGFSVLVANAGPEAIALASTHTGPIDLLLTDVVMPAMGGPVLAVALRAFRPELKALFMSGYTDDAVVRHGLLDATVDFIQKPFSPRALARKVRDVLDGVRVEA